MATKKSAIPKPEVVTKAASTTVKRKKKKSSYKPKPNVTRVCRSAGRGCQGRSASACRTLASAKCKVKRVSSASTTTATTTATAKKKTVKRKKSTISKLRAEVKALKSKLMKASW